MSIRGTNLSSQRSDEPELAIPTWPTRFIQSNECFQQQWGGGRINSPLQQIDCIWLSRRSLPYELQNHERPNFVTPMLYANHSKFHNFFCNKCIFNSLYGKNLIFIWPRIRCLLKGVRFILDAHDFELHKRLTPRDMATQAFQRGDSETKPHCLP